MLRSEKKALEAEYERYLEQKAYERLLSARRSRLAAMEAERKRQAVREAQARLQQQAQSKEEEEVS